jgi:glycosyltransferase 2 family protein
VSGLRSPTYPLYVAGASCVAWAVGLVVVFAPGGVGVRELVYVWMLSGLYPTDQLRAAAVTSRLVTVAAELVVLALTYRIARRNRVPSPEAT